MWRYSQSSGLLLFGVGINGYTFQCYSGAGEGKNSPALQQIPDVGPIPCGIYDQGDVEWVSVHGPFAIPLFPRPENDMFGRSGFMIHGDSLIDPGNASKGCIIHSPQRDREIIYNTRMPILVTP